MQIVIDIPEDVLKRTVFYREFRDLNDCITTIKALEKATPLTKGHVELDGMTNGDVIKAMFPNAEYKKDSLGDIWIMSSVQLGTITLRQEWWNAPYKSSFSTAVTE